MVDKKEQVNFSQTSYIFGIVSIVMALFTPLLGLVFGIVGLVQSAKQKTDVSKLSKKLNIIGIVLSIIIFGVSLFFLLKGFTLPSLPSG
ncbi:MAG TPA: DUF4190 domain-containing protein [Candidatus Nanoarchaeia archaeon]|nr:DUF4190 domain-containing protein [Candidatus Nanoarchaeia archaeon]